MFTPRGAVGVEDRVVWELDLESPFFIGIQPGLLDREVVTSRSQRHYVSRLADFSLPSGHSPRVVGQRTSVIRRVCDHSHLQHGARASQTAISTSRLRGRAGAVEPVKIDRAVNVADLLTHPCCAKDLNKHLLHSGLAVHA